ncbi:hypothetical protein C0995_006029 [Termitomyces sp. Mi166|nr:hypothetical protein C0995_006029 [Termitomyces sp. Mi166\
MSARQNKKQRKGRNNPNNRERTVTTLTEDPNSSYLIPLSSEDPPGALMSSPFSISSSAGNGPSSSAYQPPSSYEAYGYADFSSQSQIISQQVQQQPQQQQAPPVPGKNDLERLQNLKNIIKANQHANYRPIAQPAALASLYLGPIPTSQAQLEQNQFGNADASSQALSTTGSSPSSPADHGRRPPRLSSKEWENSVRGKPTTTNGGQPTNNVLSDSSPISAHLLTSSSSFSFSTQTNSPIQSFGGRFNQGTNATSVIDTSSLQGSAKTNSAGPLSAGPKLIDGHMSDTQSPRLDSGGARPTSGNSDPARIPVETGYGGPRGLGSTDKSSFNTKEDSSTPRDSSWSMRDGLPPPDDRRRDLDRPPPSPRPALNGSGGGSDTRSNPSDRPLMSRDPPPPRDDRFYDRDRERERERYDRDRRDWDRDRRSSYERFRPPPDVIRRPPPEQRHYKPDYSERGPLPPRYDIVKEEPISDSRRLADLRRPPSPTADDRPPVRPEDDRLPLSGRLPPLSSDSRAPPADVSRPPHSEPRAPVPPQRVLSPDNRPVRGVSFDDRHVKPATLPEERRGASVPPDVRAPPSSVRPTDIPSATRPADARDRERDVPLAPVDAPRVSIPLEERISRPSLQERISSAQPEHLSQPPPPPASRPEPSRPLEERLSAIPVSADSREQRGRIPDRAERPPPPPPPPSRPPQTIDDRVVSRPPLAQDDRRIDDRPGRYTRGMSPAGDRSTYPPPVRDDPHKGLPSSAARDYRPPPRPVSHERSATSYRPDDRNYITDDRRTDAMDVDTSSRYNDSRSIPYNRPFSPPSAADLARDRARAAQYPPSPSRPLPTHDSYDDERRYASSRDWAPSYQSSYSDRRREWSAADEEYYKSRQWDRNPPPPPATSAPERDRYDREPALPVVRNNGWETRDERERRDYPPPRVASPSRPYDGPPRSLSSRLTDTYNSTPSGGASADRSYASRDAPPPFSRVRQRSLSPARRSTLIDDARPPAKRSREDGYAAGEYYPPSSAPSARDPGAPPLRRQDNYPPLPRAASPPATSAAGSAYFDNRGPPPSSSSSAVSGGERDYPPREYPVQSYERPRSPPRGAAYSRGGYSRDTRDDRRYPPPPPPPSMLPPRRP